MNKIRAMAWNKIEPINGICADTVIKSHKIKDVDEVFLVSINNIVNEIQFKNNIILKYNLEPSLTCEQVAQKYLEMISQEEQKQQENIKTLETQQLEIDTLKKQNADFENALVELASMVGGA